MGREKGCQKFGGRKKGTPNRRTQELKDLFESINFNVPEEIRKILNELEPEKKADILIKLLEYIYPKRKAVDVTDHSEPKQASKSPLDLSKLSDEELEFMLSVHDKYS